MLPFNPFSALTSKIYGGVAIAALTFAAVQTVRIEGPFFFHGYKEEVADLRKQLAEAEAASKVNQQAAKDQVERWEGTSTNVAKDNQNEYRQNRSAVGNAVRDYANANRVRTEVRCSNAAPAAEGKDTPVPVDLPADTGLVAIREPDLQALAEWALIGIQAHNHAVEKIEAGLAEPMEEAPREPLELPEPAFGNPNP
jgi:hypothetical protein